MSPDAKKIDRPTIPTRSIAFPMSAVTSGMEGDRFTLHPFESLPLVCEALALPIDETALTIDAAIEWMNQQLETLGVSPS